MIAARFGPGTLEVRGHAGFARAGADIVCAAASMLCFALRAALEVEKIQHETAVEDGRMHVRAWPVDARRERVEGMFAVCRAGFRLLAERYPGCVQILSEERSLYRSGSGNGPETGQKEEKHEGRQK